MKRAVLASIAMSALLAFSVPAAKGGPAAVATGSLSSYPVTGYVLEGGAPKVIRREASRVTDIGIDGALVSKDGSSLRIGKGLRTALEAAHAQGKPASLLVANYDNSIGDFSPAIADRLLTSPANRTKVAGILVREVADHGWDGLTIDLEALNDDNRDGLVAFLTELREAVPEGTTLDIDIPASSSPGGYQWRPFDRPAIAAVVDRVVLMSYDQHYQGGTPGPIAGIAWVRKTIRVATKLIPRSKLRLGIAGYGYLWKEGRPTVDLTDRQARRLAGGRARWSQRHLEWTAKMPGGGVIWWSDARSMKIRIRLAKARGLEGAAVWRLGSADNFR